MLNVEKEPHHSISYVTFFVVVIRQKHLIWHLFISFVGWQRCLCHIFYFSFCCARNETRFYLLFFGGGLRRVVYASRTMNIWDWQEKISCFWFTFNLPYEKNMHEWCGSTRVKKKLFLKFSSIRRKHRP